MIWKTFTMEILRNLFLIFILTLLILRFLGSAKLVAVRNININSECKPLLVFLKYLFFRSIWVFLKILLFDYFHNKHAGKGRALCSRRHL